MCLFLNNYSSVQFQDAVLECITLVIVLASFARETRTMTSAIIFFLNVKIALSILKPKELEVFHPHNVNVRFMNNIRKKSLLFMILSLYSLL